MAEHRTRAAPFKIKLPKAAMDERARIVHYIRSEAKKLRIEMTLPDKIIRDTMLAIANEIVQGNHDV